MSITRRGLLGALVGLPFAAKAALGAPVDPVSPNIGDITITIPKKPHNKKIDDLTGLLLDKFFTHIIYSKFPRHIGPTVGDDIVFRQEIVPAWRLKWGLPMLTRWHGDFWYQGVNDCLAKAGIKAIYTMMVTSREMTNGDILITYHVIQGNRLPHPTDDEISRATAGIR